MQTFNLHMYNQFLIHSPGRFQTTLTVTLRSCPPWVTAIGTDTSHPVARAVVFAVSTPLLAVTAVVTICANCGNTNVNSVWLFGSSIESFAHIIYWNNICYVCPCLFTQLQQSLSGFSATNLQTETGGGGGGMEGEGAHGRYTSINLYM